MAIDEAKLEQFMGQVVTELSAVGGGAMNLIGDRLGLWKALAGAGPSTSTEVADRASCNERYVREWLAAQAAAGYIEYDGATGTFTLSDEVAFATADESSPVFLGGAWQLQASIYTDIEKTIAAVKTGEGVAWHEHSHDLFEGVERFFRPGYNAHLVPEWLPALDGVVEKLERGAKVADVGCGHGASTIILAQEYPNSTFVGFDYHDASIVKARKAAAEAGVADRVSFEVAPAQSYPGTDYDVVAFFDCLHDMGDPEGAARHVRSTLAADGTWLLVEPMASETLTDSINPLARLYYASSVTICLPASLAQDVALGLGNQVPESRYNQLITDAGFSRFRRAAETPFNRVFEARP
jgi:2-polyprenyl-3-methyl-5-hydroxy-6-metoxy-1,4-benzoquinol methylase